MFRNIAIDQFSFWAGFLAGILVLWLLRRLSPFVRQEFASFKSRLKEIRTRGASRTEELFLLDALKRVQKLHIAAPLFSLDEILIEPRLFGLPPPIDSPADDQFADIVGQAIPFLPDWPQLAAWYGAKTISLAQALSGGADLVLVGLPGSGKTVAMAHLLCQLVRRDENTRQLSSLLPVFVHLSDLLPQEKFTASPLEHILTSTQIYSLSLSEKQLEILVRDAYQDQRLLLLLDGLDESSPALHAEALAFLQAVRAEKPSIRIIVAASTEDLHGLLELGLVPIPMAAWSEPENEKFIRNWSKRWTSLISPTLPGEISVTDSKLLNSWLSDGNTFSTPLEITLKTWAGFSGDALGSDPSHAIEAYLSRLKYDHPKVRQALEEMALQLIVKQKIASSPKDIRGWENILPSDGDSRGVNGRDFLRTRRAKKRSLKTLPGLFPELEEYGLLIERSGGRLAFSHPIIAGYLAACALSETRVMHFLDSQPTWTGKSLTSIYLAGLSDVAAEASEFLNGPPDPLERKLLTISRWLRVTHRGPAWRTTVLRTLAASLQNTDLAIGLRFRILAALLYTEDQGIAVLLRQLRASPRPDQRQLAAIGLGLIRDQASLPSIVELLHDPHPGVVRAACMALVSIGDRPALEALAEAILHGSEDLRRSAAKALAYHPVEGHPILKDGSEMEDLLVRRSVVYGLARLRQPWARQILDKLAVDDEEWIVRTAATHALEQMALPDPGIPRPKPPLNESIWLITFAGERGIGVAPGKPAQELMLKALDEGNREHKLAAMEHLRYNIYSPALPILNRLLSEDDEELKQAAYETLWYNAVSGATLP